MTDPLNELTDLTEDQLAADPRIGMRKIVFEFLLHQQYFGAAAMMVAEFIASIQQIEAAENSGNLSVPSVKTAAILWRNEIKGFKYWYGTNDDATIARLMLELADKGMQQFVAELAVALQVDHPESQVPDE
jgi:hypothetical protein